MAFMLGVRIVSYGVVGAAAILTHETTKAYKERLYHWAWGKFKSNGSPPHPGGPTHDQCDAENQPTRQHSLDGDAHLSFPQPQQQQQQQHTTTTSEDDDALLFLPQLQQHQQPTTTTCKDDAHLSVLLPLQQFTATKKKDDDTHLSVLQQQQQLTTADKEDVANLPMLQQRQQQQQQQQLTAAAHNHDADLLVQQDLTAARNNHDAYVPVQQRQLTAIGKDNDIDHLNHDHVMKTGHLIGEEFELKASSETSKDHDDVRIEGETKQEQQVPRLLGRGATFFAKVFNPAKSQLHGFFCWARGLFEEKRWATVRRVIPQIVRNVFLLFADDLFHHVFKRKHPVLRQFSTVIYNEVKKASL
ncbi:hypothetical protein DsansV1_C13g0127451 [Dioscorea sansibarensis]